MEVIDSDLKEINEEPHAGKVGNDPDRVDAFEIREIFDSFTPEKWKEFTKRLWVFFNGKYELDPRLNWEDMVQDAYLLMLQDRRHLYPRKTTLLKCVCDVIRSNGGHILDKMNKNPLEPIDQTSNLMSLSNLNPSVWEEIRELVRGDSDVSRIVEVFFKDSGMKPRHLREELPDLSEKDIANALRRLRRLFRLKKEQ